MQQCVLLCQLAKRGSRARGRIDVLHDAIVEPVCVEFGYKVSRMEVPTTGHAKARGTAELMSCDLVIADVENGNSEVLSHLAIRHASERPTIVLVPNGGRAPSKCEGQQILRYRLDTSLQRQAARQKLIQSIEELVHGEHTESTVDSVTLSLSGNGHVSINDDKLPARKAFGALQRRKSPRRGNAYNRRVFIVHGHDVGLKNELARFLERLGLQPVILHEQPDRGQTIIQKLRDESSDVGFAFILHTPDDEGRVRDSPAMENMRPRSRQNVIFEHGLFVGQLSAKRVCAIVREGVEFPSDLAGVVYKKIPQDGGIGSIAIELLAELSAAGYCLDANRLVGY